MVESPARAYLVRYGWEMNAYDEAVSLLRRRYANKEKQSRLLK